MGLSRSIKPISYLKANAADIIRNIHKRGEPLIITQNGEAKAVVINIDDYERIMEAVAMLKLINQSENDIRAGRVEPLADVFEKIRRSGKPE